MHHLGYPHLQCSQPCLTASCGSYPPQHLHCWPSRGQTDGQWWNSHRATQTLETNDNRDHMLELCAAHNLKCLGTWFQHWQIHSRSVGLRSLWLVHPWLLQYLDHSTPESSCGFLMLLWCQTKKMQPPTGLCCMPISSPKRSQEIWSIKVLCMGNLHHQSPPLLTENGSGLTLLHWDQRCHQEILHWQSTRCKWDNSRDAESTCRLCWGNKKKTIDNYIIINFTISP